MIEDMADVRTVLTVTSPFLASIVRAARIISTKAVPTACVNERGEIFVNPDFFAKLSFPGKVFVIAHEVLHAALLHPSRRGSRDRFLWNMAADCSANSILSGMIKVPYDLANRMVDADVIQSLLLKAGIRVAVVELKKMTAEEIYDLLSRTKRKSDRGSWLLEDDLIPGVEGEGQGGEVVQEGDEGIYSPGNTPEDVEEGWRRKLAEAYAAQKTAGRMPAGLERIVEKLLKHKVNWRALLRQHIRDGLGKTVVSTYRRPSRKVDVFPGTRRFTLPKTWILVDTSGSIGERELEQFLGEVYEVARNTEVTVICWDGEAYDPVEAKKPADVITKVMRRMCGGGGTVIAPALKRTLKRMRYGDVVIVLTDGEIYDIEYDETSSLLRAVSSKASVAVMATTHRVPKLPNGWRIVKIEV